MTLCVHCQKQKGKRNCPALKGLICPRCCGQYRLVEISCPPDCPYLKSHGAYQREKAGVGFTQERHRLYHDLFEQKGEKAARFLQLVDNLFYIHFSRKPGVQDWEVLSALEELRRRLSPITIPGVSGLASGEAVWKDLQGVLEREPVDTEVAGWVLDKLCETLRTLSPDYHHSNRYLTGFLGYVEASSPELARKVKGSQDQEATNLIFPGR